MDWDLVPITAAVGGGAGILALAQAFVTVSRLVRQGVSVREGKRRVDIVQQRDEALEQARRERERADAEQARADWADANRQIAVANEQRAREHAAELRVQLVERAGLGRDELPTWPDMDRTIPRAEFDRLRRSNPPAAD